MDFNQWDDGQQRCRADQQHPWEDRNVVETEFGFVLHQRCPRCGNERSYAIAHTGHRSKRIKRVYVDNYLLPKGSGRLNDDERAALRLRSVERLVKQFKSKKKGG